VIIGPGPQFIRRAILKTCQRHKRIFNRAGGKVNQKWKTVYNVKILNPSDYEDPDFDAMRNKIQDRWERFLDVDLPKINEVLAEVPWEELQKRINELKEEQRRVEAD
jgi:hypothetical protein